MNLSTGTYFQQALVLVGLALLAIALARFCARRRVVSYLKSQATLAGIRHLVPTFLIRGLGCWLLYVASAHGYFTEMTHMVLSIVGKSDCPLPPYFSCLEYFAQFLVLFLAAVYFILGAPHLMRRAANHTDSSASDWQALKCLTAVTLVVALLTYLSDRWTTNDAGTVPLKRITLRQLIPIATNSLGIKLALAETPFSSSAHLTNRELLNEFRSIPQLQRTRTEASLIRSFEDLMKRHPNFNLDVPFAKEERHDFNLPKNILTSRDKENLADAISRFDKRYSLGKSHGIYVLSNKDSVVNTERISLHFSHVRLRDLYAPLAKILSEKGINLGDVPRTHGWGSDSARYWPSWMPVWGGEIIKYDLENLEDREITLHMDNVTLGEAFCQFAQALSPTVTWQLFESGPQSVLHFFYVNETDCWNSTLDSLSENYR